MTFNIWLFLCWENISIMTYCMCKKKNCLPCPSFLLNPKSYLGFSFSIHFQIILFDFEIPFIYYLFFLDYNHLAVTWALNHGSTKTFETTPTKIYIIWLIGKIFTFPYLLTTKISWFFPFYIACVAWKCQFGNEGRPIYMGKCLSNSELGSSFGNTYGTMGLWNQTNFNR